MAKRKRKAMEPQRTATQLRNARPGVSFRWGGQQFDQVYIDDPLRAPTVQEAQHFLSGLTGRRVPLRLKSKEGNGKGRGHGRTWKDGEEWLAIFGQTGRACRNMRYARRCVARAPISRAPLGSWLFTGGLGLWFSSGDLRYVKLEVQRSTERVQVTLVWNAASLEEAQRWVMMPWAGAPLTKLVSKLQRAEDGLLLCCMGDTSSAGVALHLGQPQCRRQAHLTHSGLRQGGSADAAADPRVGLATPLRFPAPAGSADQCATRRGQANLCAFEDIVSLARRFVPPESSVVERGWSAGRRAQGSATVVRLDDPPVEWLVVG
eukprot:Skav211724  [mRNA]  locus=scaffold1965:26185:33696:- [translate_table: standard]